MMGFGKKQIILAALVIALGTAVYLNWQLSSDQGLSDDNSIISTKELGEAQFVNNTPTPENSEENKEGNDKENKDKPKSSSEYFSKAKSERQKAREEATEVIKETLENAKSSEQAKAESVKQAAEIAKNIEKESNIENLIKAKGVADCLAFIQNDECSVVVGGTEALNENLAVVIKDIVAGQGGIAPDKIKIVEAK